MGTKIGTLEEQLRDTYTTRNGGTVRATVLYLEAYSRAMLRKTALIPGLERAKALRDVSDDYFVASFKDEKSQRIHSHVFKALSDCHEPIVDDLLLISAFEMFAKATLLRKGYSVHEVKEPRYLANQQKSKPLHRNELRTLARKGNSVIFQGTTLKLSVLLGKQYSVHYPMSEAAWAGLKEAKNRRNLIHFQTALIWSVTRELIAFADHLNKSVPQFNNGRRQRTA